MTTRSMAPKKLLVARLSVVALISGLLTFVSAPASNAAFSIGSATSSPVSNTGGGGQALVNCSSSRALSGITSNIDSTFDGITLTYTYGTCATLNSDGLTISSVTDKALGPYGGGGTTETSDSCSSAGGNRVVVGAKLYKTPLGYAAGVQLLCGTLPAGGSRSYSSAVIGRTTGTIQEIACNTGNVAIGLNVYYGGILDKFGVNCAPIQSASQTITFNTLTAKVRSANSTSLTSSSSSGLTVSNISNTTSVCTVSGSTITFVSSGNCSVTSSQGGDTNFAAATSVTRAFDILSAAPNVTSSNFSSGVASGWEVSVSAAGGEAVTTVGTNLGTCTSIIQADGGWVGDLALSNVTDSAFTFTVPADSTFYGWIYLRCGGSTFTINSFIQRIAAPTNTVLPAISGTVKIGQTLSSSTGTWSGSVSSYSYQWMKSATSNGTYTAIGGETNSTFVITASELNLYIKVTVTASGVGGSVSANSGATIQVTRTSQSITLASLGTSSKTFPYTQVLSMTTSGTTGTGIVTFDIFAGGTASSCALSDSSSVSTISATSAGTCFIKATIAADNLYASATSASVAFTFSKASQSALSITTASGSYGTPLTLSTSGGSGTGALSFAYSAGTSTCSLSGSTLTANAPGTCLVTATKALDDGYNSISSSQTTVTFAYGTTTASVNIATGTLYFRQSKSISAVASVAGKLTFRANNVVIATCKNLVVNSGNSYTRTCNYKPSTRGYITITVTLVPTDSSYTNTTTSSGRLFVYSRTGTR